MAPITAETWKQPTRLSGLVFAAKVRAHQARRALIDLAGGVRRLPLSNGPRPAWTAAEHRSALWPADHGGERAHQLGKTHNLRRAARALDRLTLPAGETFSFWKQAGPATAARGFAIGRMLQEGCLVPAVGGGLCQLSNALYDVALKAGCEIIERHGHSQIVPGSAAAAGRDATVAWNYVDLRFAAPQDLELEIRLTADQLIVRLLGEAPLGVRARPATMGRLPAREARSCASCDETTCFLHEGRRGPAIVRTGYVVDEAWPELRDWVADHHGPNDFLARPTFLGPAGRAWSGDGFARRLAAPVEAAQRSLAMRRLAAQGAARRAAELDAAARLARTLGAGLTADVERLVVTQSLLPFLWRDGHLGGRPFEVLMTRWPMAALQARLDAAFARHPDRHSLADFRAPPWLVEAEAEALDAAEQLVTPHSALAAHFGRRARQIDWRAPPPPPGIAVPADHRRIVFPGPTAARKGAWEVREAARALDLQVVLPGSQLEGADFWEGVETAVPDSPDRWLAGAFAVVQPAVIEDQPRRLLQALAAGVPVIATEACGISSRPGLMLIPEGDPRALVEALERVGSASRATA